MKNYALITGASKGLGKCFSTELAKRKYNLILVSLPDEGLKETAIALEEQHSVEVHIHETDLGIKENVLNLANWVNKNFSVNILINNAGIGGSKHFSDAKEDYLNDIIQLNVMAPTLLTAELLPNLKNKENAYILNVSSLAALSPMAYKTVYPASKAFIQSFSRGLNRELKHTPVSVSVVNPGGMKTNAETTKRLNKQGFIGQIASRKPEIVARYCINGLLMKKEVIKVNFLSWLFLKTAPSWLLIPILSRRIKKELG
ncbi:MAG TPA: SDR family NAD(P)-dependent oxidoreductase [Flavobacteriaceae bacterium]|nr:SDR family NAD(P)-dependent oxidoreductase [Flavobacteriaceae bacterium]